MQVEYNPKLLDFPVVAERRAPVSCLAGVVDMFRRCTSGRSNSSHRAVKQID